MKMISLSAKDRPDPYFSILGYLAKTFILLLYCGLSLAAQKDAPLLPKVREPAESEVSETHRFTGLTLKGQLKKPDLSYIYRRAGLRSEQIVDIPENFD